MKKIVVGISGASGVPLAIHLLKQLKALPDVETHLVLTEGAKMTILQESKYRIAEVENLADIIYDNKNIGASIASGTFEVDGMIVIPCSMKTLAGITYGYSDNLLLRACDVQIKEQRTLVLVTRETPLSMIHMKNMLELSKISSIHIMPPMLTYYNHPETIEDMEIHIIGKILKKFQISIPNFKPWK